MLLHLTSPQTSFPFYVRWLPWLLGVALVYNLMNQPKHCIHRLLSYHCTCVCVYVCVLHDEVGWVSSPWGWPLSFTWDPRFLPLRRIHGEFIQTPGVWMHSCIPDNFLTHGHPSSTQTNNFSFFKCLFFFLAPAFLLQKHQSLARLKKL